jgi:hypothetical protein
LSIFPFLNGPSDSSTIAQKQIPREYAWDFNLNDFILIDGKPVIVEGIEAIKVWVYKALSTQRYRYLAYSWDHGHEFERLIGNTPVSKQALQSEASRYVQEALQMNTYIKSIKDMNASVTDDKISLAFTIVTDYGEAAINV